MFRSTLAIAATLVGMAFSSVSAATFDATSYNVGGVPEHSVWFSGPTNPAGSLGPKNNHFLFENSGDQIGSFVQNGTDIGDTASLTGQVLNAAGQGFDLMLSLIVVADPGTYKQVAGSVRDDWIYYDLDAGGSNMLNSVTPALVSFDIILRGAGLMAQFGTGANDKNATLLGFSTWISLTEKNCTSNCQSYNGDINILLNPSPIPLPAGLPLLAGGLGLLGWVGRRRRKS